MVCLGAMVAPLCCACSTGDDEPGDDAFQVTETRTTLTVGATPVDLVLFATEAPGLTYINVHDDEQTSVEAGIDLIGQHGGRVFELQHGSVRNISFSLSDPADDNVYVFDPNRMFTDIGALASLQRWGPISNAAFEAVRAFADQVLAAYDLPELKAVITLHNNAPEDDYSVSSYDAGGPYEQEAQAVFVAAGADPRDFFFVTDADLYDALAAEGFNVVLQDNENATDDGSLSVYAAADALPYANSEAFDDHYDEQLNMLLALERIVLSQN